MSEEILINVTLMETRVALIENGLLQEVFIERHNKRGHVGDVFKLLVVQVAKDAISTKGARLTTHITLPSRNLVYLPRSKHLGISQRLADEERREHLLAQLNKGLAEEGVEGQGGFIIRTAAVAASKKEFKEDIRFLKRLWNKIDGRISQSDEVKRVYREASLYIRTVRDLITPRVRKIRVDNQTSYDEINQFLEDFIPELEVSVEIYEDDRPIFDLYAIEDEINKALGRQVKLKSGGDLIIDQTEAMTTIDVNTGSYLGNRNHAETILKTNLEAAAAIARQLRIRNLGGMIGKRPSSGENYWHFRIRFDRDDSQKDSREPRANSK